MVDKQGLITEELNLKLSLKDKEEMIDNKEQLIQSIQRQLQLDAFLLKELRLNKSIAVSHNIDAELKKLINEL
jgi:hypothetical protein